MHKFNVNQAAALLEETGRSCTTFIAGRQVTVDGSRIFGRTDDSHGLVAAIMAPVPAAPGSHGCWCGPSGTPELMPWPGAVILPVN